MPMESTSFFAPFSHAFALLNRPYSLLCIAIMIASQMLGNMAITTFSGPYPPGGHRFAQVVLMLVPLVKYAVFALVFYAVSRKFGGAEGSAGKPNLVIWIALILVYFLTTKLASMTTTMVLGSAQDHPLRVPLALSAVSFGVRMVFYPVMILIVSALHGARRFGIGDVLSFLTSRGKSWCVCYALFGVLFAAALLVLPLAMGTESGVPPSGALFAIAMVGAGGQLIGIYFAVAAYRAMCGQSQQN
jgi:hypothetical protein